VVGRAKRVKSGGNVHYNIKNISEEIGWKDVD
jgi:hypothetical protein